MFEIKGLRLADPSNIDNTTSRIVQTIDMPQKRNLKIKKAVSVFSSLRALMLPKPTTGQTSTRRTSKHTEEFEKWKTPEGIKKPLIVSPMIKLDKRPPVKELSKESYISRTSKNSKRNTKRVPKKYTKPNLSREEIDDNPVKNSQNLESKEMSNE